MFNSLKSFAVAAGLVGAILVSNVQAKSHHSSSGSHHSSSSHHTGGSKNTSGANHIKASHPSSSKGSGKVSSSFKPSTTSQKPENLKSVKPVNKPSKVGKVSDSSKVAKLDNGNQSAKQNKSSKGKNDLAANKNQNFKNSTCKNQKSSKYCKPFCGCWPHDWCWNSGCCGFGCWDWDYCGGYYGYGYYDCCCSEYYVPEYTSYCYASPAVVAAPVADFTPVVGARQVRVINQVANETALSFVVGSQTYTLQAGESKVVDTTSGNELQFDRGNGDTARYTLTDGTYSFGATPTGWELYHGNPTTTATAATAVTTPFAEDAIVNE